jgi:hypothetical protein
MEESAKKRRKSQKNVSSGDDMICDKCRFVNTA